MHLVSPPWLDTCTWRRVVLTCCAPPAAYRYKRHRAIGYQRHLSSPGLIWIWPKHTVPLSPKFRAYNFNGSRTTPCQTTEFVTSYNVNTLLTCLHPLHVTANQTCAFSVKPLTGLPTRAYSCAPQINGLKPPLLERVNSGRPHRCGN
jgi:hypothetical protein